MLAGPVAAAADNNDSDNGNDGERGRGKRRKNANEKLIKVVQYSFPFFRFYFRVIFLSFVAPCAVKTNLFLNNFSRATEFRRHFHRELVDSKRVAAKTYGQWTNFLHSHRVCVHLQRKHIKRTESFGSVSTDSESYSYSNLCWTFRIDCVLAASVFEFRLSCRNC